MKIQQHFKKEEIVYYIDYSRMLIEKYRFVEYGTFNCARKTTSANN